MIRWKYSFLLFSFSCVAVDAEDIDGDGIANVVDNCVDIKNAKQEDIDDDNIGDLCDNCRDDSNEDQSDEDSDGVGDFCDNCQNIANPDQRNNDEDTLGDACDNCDNFTNQNQQDSDGDNTGDACDNCLNLSSPDLTDSDIDGIGNPCDCDPFDPEVGPELPGVDLGDPESLLPAQGYAFANWTHNSAAGTTLQNAAIVDNRLDSALLAFNQQLSNVFVEVTAASTEAINFGTGANDRLVLITARYNNNANSTGAACGIRVDNTQAVSQRLQLLNISGTSGTPLLTQISDQQRDPVAFGETFKLSFKLRGSNSSCKITFLQQGNATQIINATNTTNQSGSIGLMTKETKASFSNAKICQVF